MMALDLSLVIMLGGLVGARALHVLYEGLEYYTLRPFDVFKLWQGGFVFYGGFFGALASSFLYVKLKRESFLFWADFFAPVVALGYALGRIACFLNGCCFGRTCDLPWAVEFQHPGLPSGLRHPTQLYASAWELCTFLVLLTLERKQPRQAGFIFATWLALHGFGRIVMEYFRDDFRGQEFFDLSLSTWISALLIISAFALLFKIQKKSET